MIKRCVFSACAELRQSDPVGFYFRFRICEIFPKALSVKACQPPVNTNASLPPAQHVFTRFPRCLVNWLRQVFHCRSELCSRWFFPSFKFAAKAAPTIGFSAWLPRPNPCRSTPFLLLEPPVAVWATPPGPTPGLHQWSQPGEYPASSE